MIEAERIIVRPLVTEKATEASSHLNQYYFEVSGGSNRISVKQAIEKQFEVKVLAVNILNVRPKVKRDRSRRGKSGQKPGYKKAIVRLKDGDTIDLT